MQNNTEKQVADLARNLLVLQNYKWIKQEAESINVRIVPIKGIDLLQTIYSDSLERPVRDIDILCYSEEDCIRLAERLCQEEYRLEFPFSLRKEALHAKQKVSLLSCNTTKVNVDIHTRFVTKKFFSRTIVSFNEDAILRCHDCRMEASDRWLFLAQHATFHLFSDMKWTIDLLLLLNGFSRKEQKELLEKATIYHFRRVMLATVYHIGKIRPDVSDRFGKILLPSSSECRFLRFITYFDRPIDRRPINRLIAAYWEFAFVDKRKDRVTSWLRLMFPSKGSLMNIYRVKSRTAIFLIYPLSIIIVGLTGLLFGIIYAIICNVKKQ